MPEIHPTLPPGIIREWLAYDPDSGRMTWTDAHPVKARQPAAFVAASGHFLVQFPESRKTWFAMHLAWVLQTGTWSEFYPLGLLRYTGRLPDDLRWSNIVQSPWDNNLHRARLVALLHPPRTRGSRAAPYHYPPG
jgi:hypothetical protein